MVLAQNPFHWRGTVTEAEAFVGREAEMRSILVRLSSLGCISIVGDRRIGKSSLLYQVSRRAAEALGAACRPVYVDLLSAKHHSLDGLLTTIHHALTGEQVALLGWTPAEKLASLVTTVRKVRGAGLLPVIFLDEFECVGARPQEFGDDLLESWRSLGNDRQIAFVTSSAQSLDRVTQESGLTSSFYNIFAQSRLGEFTEAEARAFAENARQVGDFAAGDDALLLRVGGQHPLRLQVTAWHLFEARRSGGADPAALAQAVADDLASVFKS